MTGHAARPVQRMITNASGHGGRWPGEVLMAADVAKRAARARWSADSLNPACGGQKAGRPAPALLLSPWALMPALTNSSRS